MYLDRRSPVTRLTHAHQPHPITKQGAVNLATRIPFFIDFAENSYSLPSRRKLTLCTMMAV